MGACCSFCCALGPVVHSAREAQLTMSGDVSVLIGVALWMLLIVVPLCCCCLLPGTPSDVASALIKLDFMFGMSPIFDGWGYPKHDIKH